MLYSIPLLVFETQSLPKSSLIALSETGSMPYPPALVFSGAVAGACFSACLYVAMEIQTNIFMLMQKTSTEANTQIHKPNFIQNSLVISEKTLQFTCCVSNNTEKSKQVVNCFTI